MPGYPRKHDFSDGNFEINRAGDRVNAGKTYAQYVKESGYVHKKGRWLLPNEVNNEDRSLWIDPKDIKKHMGKQKGKKNFSIRTK